MIVEVMMQISLMMMLKEVMIIMNMATMMMVIMRMLMTIVMRMMIAMAKTDTSTIMMATIAMDIQMIMAWSRQFL